MRQVNDYSPASGFGSVELLCQYEHEPERLAKLGRQMDYIVKWNPRRGDRQAWVARAAEEDAFKEVRPGNRPSHYYWPPLWQP